MNIISIENKPSWGNDRYYPVNEFAQAAAQLHKSTTLPPETWPILKRMGFSVVLVSHGVKVKEL